MSDRNPYVLCVCGGSYPPGAFNTCPFCGHDPRTDEQERRWALIEMGLVDVQSQPDEIRAVGIDPDTHIFIDEPRGVA